MKFIKIADRDGKCFIFNLEYITAVYFDEDENCYCIDISRRCITSDTFFMPPDFDPNALYSDLERLLPCP